MEEIIQIQKLDLDSRKRSVNNWKVPEENKQLVLRFLEQLELGKVNKGKKIAPRRQAKYLDLLKVSLEFFNKPISKITLKDTEDFENEISKDKIISHLRNKPYSPSTKSDIKSGLKIFLKWKLGSVKAERLAGWMDTSVKEKTIEYLNETEIEKLYKHCKNSEQRFLIAVLFDSGARATEFHNIRFEDIEMPKTNDNFIKITLKTEYSKTKGRTISLYWKNSLEAVSDYLKERINEGIKPKEPIFKNKYDNARIFLYRLGKKVLQKNVHYHLFRHSSATFFANKLNRQELCYRYGWAFSSNMPDVYISRSGMQNKELDEKFTNTELGELKAKFNKGEFERKKMQEVFDNREKEYFEKFDYLTRELESLKKTRQINTKIMS